MFSISKCCLGAPADVQHSGAMAGDIRKPIVPERPKLSRQAMNTSTPFSAGAERLTDMAVGFLNRLDARQKAELRTFLSDAMGSRIRIGTACSGTDAPVLAWGAFAAGCRRVLSLSLQVFSQSKVLSLTLLWVLAGVWLEYMGAGFGGLCATLGYTI